MAKEDAPMIERVARRVAPLTAGFLLASTLAAFAHAHLRSAVPAVGSTVETPPKQVEILFSEAVEPRFSRIEVAAEDGRLVSKEDVRTAPDNPARLIVSLGDLVP